MVALAVATVSLAAADAPRDRFGVGILRRDGIIIPFAAFDGRNWSAHWPKPALDLTVPVSVASVPSRWWGPTGPLDSWQVTTLSEAKLVRVVQPDWVDIHCARQIGLRTDYRASQLPPPPTEQPYPKDGIAIAPAHAIDRIDILPLAGEEARGLLPEVQKAFNEAERKTEERYGHPITRRAREGIEPTIEAAYGWGRTPRVYYVEATRSYRELGQFIGDCAGVGFGTGWFLGDASGIRPVTMKVDVLNCSRDSASYMLPLGVMRLNDRTFWLAQFSGFDHERYVVLEAKEHAVDVVINTWGGAC
jgi:hypothetical protein